MDEGNFVVEQSSQDIFKVDTGLTNSIGQDIGYSKNCGLFIPRTLNNNGDLVKNTIVWIRLDSIKDTNGNKVTDNREYTSENSSYRHITLTK